MSQGCDPLIFLYALFSSVQCWIKSLGYVDITGGQTCFSLIYESTLCWIAATYVAALVVAMGSIHRWGVAGNAALRQTLLHVFWIPERAVDMTHMLGSWCLLRMEDIVVMRVGGLLTWSTTYHFLNFF